MGFPRPSLQDNNVYIQKEGGIAGLVRVIYAPKEQERSIQNLINIIDNKLLPEEIKLVFARLSSSFLKNSAFVEEQEIRIALVFTDEISNFENAPIPSKNIEGYFFRNMQDRISPYYTYTFPLKSLRSIRLGPQNKSETKEIEHFLKLNKYTHDIIIKTSAASYRNTK